MVQLNMRNQATIEGLVGLDPVLRHTSKDTPVCNLSVAVSNNYYDEDTADWVKRDATWVTVTLWDKAAERCVASTGKGLKVRVSGKLASHTRKIKRTIEVGTEKKPKSIEVELEVTELYIEAAQISYLDKKGQQASNSQVPMTKAATEAMAEPDF